MTVTPESFGHFLVVWSPPSCVQEDILSMFKKTNGVIEAFSILRPRIAPLTVCGDALVHVHMDHH